MSRILYDRFTSQNDTGVGAALKDTELREAVNVFFGDGSATTRPGTSLLHPFTGLPPGGALVNSMEFAGSLFLIYKEGTAYKLYRAVPGATAGYPWTLSLVKSDLVKEPTCFVMRTAAYVADGDNLYEYGRVDYLEASGTVDVKEYDVVKNTPLSSGGGVLGQMYRAKTARSAVNLAAENYANTTNWEPVGQLSGTVSDYIRAVRPKNAAAKEKVKLVIGYNAAAAGNVTVTLNKVPKTVAIASGDTATAVAGKIRAAAYTGWITSGSGQTVFFEATTAGRMDDTDHEYDAGDTQAYGVMSVSVQGKVDDNDFARLKKCQTFVQHPKSRRVFAIGDPTDPTCVFLSGSVQYPDDMTYWSQGTQLYPTTPEQSAVALHVLTDATLVGFTSNWYAYEGVDPAVDATWRRLNLPIGPLSHRTVVSVPNGFVFATRLRTLHFVSANILNSEIILLQGQENVQDLTSSRMDEFLKDAVGTSGLGTSRADLVYHDGRVLFAVTPEGVEASKIMAYDLSRNGFSTLQGWLVRNWHLQQDGTLAYLGAVQPVLFDESREKDVDGVTGEDVPVRTIIQSKDFDLGDGMTNKYLFQVDLLLKQYEENTTQLAGITVLGGYRTKAYQEVPLDESLVWGRSWNRTWGFSEFMTLSGYPHIVNRIFGVRLESDSPVGLYGIGFQFRPLRLQGRDMTTGRELIE